MSPLTFLNSLPYPVTIGRKNRAQDHGERESMRKGKRKVLETKKRDEIILRKRCSYS